MQRFFSPLRSAQNGMTLVNNLLNQLQCISLYANRSAARQLL